MALTLANPLYLVLLPLIGIPILINLFKRRLRVVEFPDVRLIEEAEQKKRRRIRLREILKIIIRVLIISSLIFALTGPVIISGGEYSKVYVVIDDSPSMVGSGENERPIDKAKVVAKEIVERFSQYSDVYIYRLSEPQENYKSGNPSASFNFIDDIETGFVYIHNELHLSTILNEIEGGEVFYISDHSPATLPDDISDENIHFQFVNCGMDERRYIDKYRLTRKDEGGFMDIELGGTDKTSPEAIEVYQEGRGDPIYRIDVMDSDFRIDIPEKEKAGYVKMVGDNFNSVGSYIFWGSSKTVRTGVFVQEGSLQEAIRSFGEGYEINDAEFENIEKLEFPDISNYDLIIVENDILTPSELDKLREYIEGDGKVITFNTAGITDFTPVDLMSGVEFSPGGLKASERRFSVINQKRETIGEIYSEKVYNIESGDAYITLLKTDEGEPIFISDTDKEIFTLLVPISTEISNTIKTPLFPYCLHMVISRFVDSGGELFVEDALFMDNLLPVDIPDYFYEIATKTGDEKPPGIYKYEGKSDDFKVGLNIDIKEFNYEEVENGGEWVEIEAENFDEYLVGEIGERVDLVGYLLLLMLVLVVFDLVFLCRV